MVHKAATLIAFSAMEILIIGLSGCYHDKAEEPGGFQGSGLPNPEHHLQLDSHEAKLGDTDVTFDVLLPTALRKTPLSHHWFFNGSPVDDQSAPALGLTDYTTPDLKIRKVTLDNCGFYTYRNEFVDDPMQGYSSETAQLLIVKDLPTPRDSSDPALVVYGTPIAGAGGSGTCPGTYVAYAEYTNPTNQLNGWSFPNGGTAVNPNDPQGTQSKVYYSGVPFANRGCGTNIPKSNYPYCFYIFFKNSVPSGPYPLQLNIK